VRDVFAHEDAKDLLGVLCVFDSDLLEDAILRVHGCLPQLLWVHLAQAFVALDANFALVFCLLLCLFFGRIVLASSSIHIWHLCREFVLLFVGVGVHNLLPFFDFIERRLRDVDIAAFDDRLEVSVKRA
jgi:hypothetical protein